jgi:hypothetical protein
VGASRGGCHLLAGFAFQKGEGGERKVDGLDRRKNQNQLFITVHEIYVSFCLIEIYVNFMSCSAPNRRSGAV